MIDAFFRQGRLIHLPAQRKKRQVVLEQIVQAFDPDREYLEAEVTGYCSTSTKTWRPYGVILSGTA